MTTCSAVLGLVLASLVAHASPTWGETQPSPAKTGAVGAPIVINGASLVPNALYLLPLTSIKPKGWMRRPLEMQAHGMRWLLWESSADDTPASAWLGLDRDA